MLFNRILNPRLTSALVRVFGMKTGENPAPTLAPEISPGYDINNWDDPTLPFIQGTRLQQSFASATPPAGEFNEWRLRNPVNSGVLLVLEEISCNTVIQWGMSFETTDWAGLPGSGLRDFRWLRQGGTQQGAGIFSRRNALTVTSWPTGRILNQVEGMRLTYVIPPGCAWNANQVNAAIFGSLQVTWREVKVAPEELATG